MELCCLVAECCLFSTVEVRSWCLDCFSLPLHGRADTTFEAPPRFKHWRIVHFASCGSCPGIYCLRQGRSVFHLSSRNEHIPFQYLVVVILSFSQHLIDNQRAFSTVKVYRRADHESASAHLPLHEECALASSSFSGTWRWSCRGWKAHTLTHYCAWFVRGVRRSDQLFVIWAGSYKGKPVRWQVALSTSNGQVHQPITLA